MIAYIATFFTHHDALVYKRDLAKIDVMGKLMPVPRKLSSSCGTCISFTAEESQLDGLTNDIAEMVVMSENKEYSIVIDNR